METPAKSEVPAIPAMTMSEIPKSAYATLPKIIGSARRKRERITELTDCFLDIFNGQKNTGQFCKALYYTNLIHYVKDSD